MVEKWACGRESLYHSGEYLICHDLTAGLNYDVKSDTRDNIAGKEESVTGNWRKSRMAGNLAELWSASTRKAESGYVERDIFFNIIFIYL